MQVFKQFMENVHYKNTQGRPYGVIDEATFFGTKIKFEPTFSCFEALFHCCRKLSASLLFHFGKSSK